MSDFKNLKEINLSHLDFFVKVKGSLLEANKFYEELISSKKGFFGLFDGDTIFGVVVINRREMEIDVKIDIDISLIRDEFFMDAIFEVKKYVMNNYNASSLNFEFNEVDFFINAVLNELGFNETSENVYNLAYYTLVFNGSPKDGISKSICKELVERYQNVEVIDAYSKIVKPCIDCNYCIDNPLKCVFDDMNDIYEKITIASNIIIVSPVHVGSVSSPLHAMLSRLQIYFNNKFMLNNDFPFGRKNGFAISVSGSDWGNQRIALDTIFKHSFAEMNCEMHTHLYLTNSDRVKDYSNRLKRFYVEVDKYVKRNEETGDL